MNCFETLGISPTKDTKEIRRAYSRLLPKYSPEKDPEGFQSLRAAYEEALSKAKEEENQKELSPIDEFMKDFEATYRCFEKRIDADCWKQLLERDVCYNIDTSKEVSDRILTFIMNNFNFPSDVWLLFNEHFSWILKKDVLYDKFPSNFVDFVMYKINNKSTFNYECLKECRENEQDVFIAEFRKISDALDYYDLYTASTSINTAQNICKAHPELQILISKYLMISGHIEEAEGLLTKLINDKEDYMDAYFCRGDLYFRIGKLNEAYDDYKMAIDIKTDPSGILYALGKCCICLKKYEEAVEYLEKVNESSIYNRDVSILLNSAYNFYRDSLLEIVRKDTTDNNLKYKLAQAYFKTSKIEESYSILMGLRETCEFTSEMYDLLSQVLMSQKNLELAYTIICEAVDKFDDNYQLNFLKADALDELGKYEESIKQYDKIISINEEFSTGYNNKAYVLNKLGRYSEALECINKAISLEPRAAHSYKNKAAALLGLKFYEDCLDACEQALNIYQYLTEAYVIKMQAFVNMGLYDEAIATYNKANGFGLRDSKLYYQKARALRFRSRYGEAIDFCDSAIELDGDNAEIYNLKGLCYYDDKKYTDAIEWFDNAINHNSNYGEAYYYKAQSLIKSSKVKEALSIIDKAIELKGENLDLFYGLKGDIMGDENNYSQAFLQYDKAVNCDPNFWGYYYSAGRALNEIGRFNDAVKYLGKAIELNPNQLDCYGSMSYSLYNLKKYEECARYCSKAIEIDSKYVLAYQNKAWALYMLGNIEQAEKQCSIALKMDGNNLNLLLLKLRILKYKELYRDALIVCDRMLELDETDDKIKEIRKELRDKINQNGNQKKGLFKSLFK